MMTNMAIPKKDEVKVMQPPSMRYFQFQSLVPFRNGSPSFRSRPRLAVSGRLSLDISTYEAGDVISSERLITIKQGLFVKHACPYMGYKL